MTVALATAKPAWFGPLDSAGTQLGTIFLYIFFASAGVAGGGLASSLVGIGPILLAFLCVLYTVHISLMLLFGKLFSLDRALLLTASNANIGGPATASALCIGKQWRSLTTPALIVGNFGYVIANLAALLLYSALPF